jgi:hypothetical protein
MNFEWMQEKVVIANFGLLHVLGGVDDFILRA